MAPAHGEMISGKYYFRTWAGAEEPQPPPGASAPAAPYALDFEVKPEKKSVGNTKLEETWSETRGERCMLTTPAGTRPWDGRDAISCLHKSNWDAQNYKTLETTYMSDNITEDLARQHRKLMKSQGMPEDEREARWRKCLAQWEGQQLDAAASRVTGTDFSLLPAGWRPKDAHFRKAALAAQEDSAQPVQPPNAPPGRPASSVPPHAGRELRPQAPQTARSATPRAPAPRAPAPRSATPRAATPREASYAQRPRGPAARYSDPGSARLSDGDTVNLSPSDLRQVYDVERPNYRNNMRSLNGWDFMAKMARRRRHQPSSDPDPSRSWAPVAHVPMNHAR